MTGRPTPLPDRLAAIRNLRRRRTSPERRPSLPSFGGAPDKKCPARADYWNSFRIIWLDWLAIDSAWTPSCCCV